MRPIASVALCGAGAVGSAYAARLHALDPSLLEVIAGDGGETGCCGLD